MAWEVPRLNYSDAMFDPSLISSIGDSITGALADYRGRRDERQAGDILSKYADSLYSQHEPGSIADHLLGAVGPHPAADPVNGRINQAFDVAGEPAGMPANQRVDQAFQDASGYAEGLGIAPPQYQSAYADAGSKYGVDPTLLVRQGRQESAFDPNAQSSAGAVGISQFMPATAQQYGINPADPMQSIDAQGHMMSDVEKQFGGNDALALMAYNWGSGNVQKWVAGGGDPSRVPAETRDYVEKITGQPFEAALGGGGGGGDQAAPQQQATPQQAFSQLPPRDVLVAMLRNPLTREIGAGLIEDARKGLLPQFDYQRVGSSLVRIDKRTGHAESIFEGQPLQQQASGRNPPAYRSRTDGSQEFVPGGPADPATIASQQRARTGGHQPRPLSQSALNTIATAGQAYTSLDRVGSAFQDDFAGYKSQAVGDTANALTRYGLDFGQGNAAGAEWWQDYQRQKNQTRHDLFGSALTKTELPQFEAADINPGMTPEVIKKNLALQKTLATNAAKRLAGAYVAQGYAPEVIESALGIPLSDLGIQTPGGGDAGGDAGGQSGANQIPPPPEGVDPDEWPTIWQHMTPDEHAQWQQ